MKSPKYFYILLAFMCIPFSKIDAQVIVNGQIDISINLPDILNRKSRKQRAPRQNPPVVITERLPIPQPVPVPCNCDESTYGTIINQNNGPRFDYQIVDATIVPFANHELDVVLHFNTGDVMVISMSEANPNDYNFHYQTHPNGYNNTIHSITLNNTLIPLHSAAVSLQPKQDYGYTAVLNLHSVYDGSFNGTVTAIHSN